MNGEQFNLFGDPQELPEVSESREYEAFVEKFKPKKTTDDCYTPAPIYEAVKNWAVKEYGIDPDSIVRPFWPGGDYKRFSYPDGCVVLDNPPFSILSQIVEYYLYRKIPFFLFAPSLTIFGSRSTFMKTNHIVCDADITYENGAVVRTAFVTSYGGDVVAQTAPELGKAIASAAAQLKQTATLPRYDYPDHVLTAAMLQKLSKYGVNFLVRRQDCMYISALDSQKRVGKSIFGCGLLLSDAAAAEKAAAEKAAAEKIDVKFWELSQRECRIVAALGQGSDLQAAQADDDPDAITFFY